MDLWTIFWIIALLIILWTVRKPLLLIGTVVLCAISAATVVFGFWCCEKWSDWKDDRKRKKLRRKAKKAKKLTEKIDNFIKSHHNNHIAPYKKRK